MFHFSRWHEMRDTVVQCNRETPMNNAVWYPFCILVPNQYGYNVLDTFLQIVPAFFMDIFLKFSGREPMWVCFLKSMSHPSRNKYAFINNNSKKIICILSLVWFFWRNLSRSRTFWFHDCSFNLYSWRRMLSLKRCKVSRLPLTIINYSSHQRTGPL